MESVDWGGEECTIRMNFKSKPEIPKKQWLCRGPWDLSQISGVQLTASMPKGVLKERGRPPSSGTVGLLASRCCGLQLLLSLLSPREKEEGRGPWGSRSDRVGSGPWRRGQEPRGRQQSPDPLHGLCSRSFHFVPGGQFLCCPGTVPSLGVSGTTLRSPVSSGPRSGHYGKVLDPETWRSPTCGSRGPTPQPLWMGLGMLMAPIRSPGDGEAEDPAPSPRTGS